MDKEGLKYSSDLEYQEAPLEPANPLWAAYSPPPPTTPPSDIEKFGCPNSPVPQGWATGFGCDITFHVVPDSEEEDVPPPLENVTPILIAVGHSVFRAGPGEIDFIPFEVHGQHCKQSNVFQHQLIILIVIVRLKDNVVVIQGDGATSLTVMEEDPLAEALDTAGQAKELSCLKFTVVLQQNMEMLRGVESVGCLLHAFRVCNVELFRRAQESTELVLAQDVEMDCFGFKASQ